jgi:hypothetical protein
MPRLLAARLLLARLLAARLLLARLLAARLLAARLLAARLLVARLLETRLLLAWLLPPLSLPTARTSRWLVLGRLLGGSRLVLVSRMVCCPVTIGPLTMSRPASSPSGGVMAALTIWRCVIG